MKIGRCASHFWRPPRCFELLLNAVWVFEISSQSKLKLKSKLEIFPLSTLDELLMSLRWILFSKFEPSLGWVSLGTDNYEFNFSTTSSFHMRRRLEGSGDICQTAQHFKVTNNPVYTWPFFFLCAYNDLCHNIKNRTDKKTKRKNPPYETETWLFLLTDVSTLTHPSPLICSHIYLRITFC